MAREFTGKFWYNKRNCQCQPIGSVQWSGYVIGEFVCDSIEKFTVGSLRCDDLEKLACLIYTDMINYFYKPEELDGKTAKFGYGLHITNLKIYDKPKELGEFKKSCTHNYECDDCKYWGFQHVKKGDVDLICPMDEPLTRPPQSWCYCEELSE